MTRPLFDSLCARIRAAGEELGHEWSWSFLYTPATTLRPSQDLFFVGLNPGGGGGGKRFREHPSCEEGNAYRCQRWGNQGPGESVLQLQVQQLFRQIAEKLYGRPNFEQLMDESLAANYVPFRSPDWSKLARKRDTLKFADGIWRDVLSFAKPSAIICIAELPYRHFIQLLIEQGYTVAEQATESCGWGNVKLSVSRFDSDAASVLLARLPHLSRFKLFGRKPSESAVQGLTARIASAMDEADR